MPLGTKNIEYFSDPNKFYRVVRGNEVYDDIVESGKIRTVGSKTYQGAPSEVTIAGREVRRATNYPSFRRGGVGLVYTHDNPNHYIVESKDKSIQPSKIGHHGRGTTHFPSDELGNPLEEGLDAKKAKIWKHIGDGKYKQLSPRLEKIKRSLLTGLSEVGKGSVEKVTGVAGKALRGASKFAGPAGVALTAGEFAAAFAEARKLGAAKIAEDYAAKLAE